MNQVYISDSIKKTPLWNTMNEFFEKENITHSHEATTAIITSEELENYLDKSFDSVIFIDRGESLFQNEKTESQDTFVYKIDSETVDQLSKILSVCFTTEEIKRRNRIIKLLNDTSTNLSGLGRSSNDIDIQQAIFHVKAYLNIYRSIDKVLRKLNRFLESSVGQLKFELLEWESITPERCEYLFSLDDNYFLSMETALELSQEQKLIVTAIFSELNRFFLKYGVRNERNIENYWENIFAEFPIPMAIMTENGELLHRNKQFSKLQLLPKKCIELSENQKVEAAGMVYICRRTKVEIEDENIIYFQFLGSESSDTHNSQDSSSTFQDLGIVSSSIAHELNNPLAGILSALEVLGLLGEKREELGDIKKAANRCKELVGVFLGFARSRPMATNENNSIPELFLNALSLLRFRMVETGVRFEFNIESHSNDKNGYNTSILTMIFYLVLSDIFTAIERKKLVTDSNIEEGIFTGIFVYEKERMSIQFNSDLISMKEVEFNKLIQNLLSLEKLNWIVEDHYIHMELKW